jgi:putative methionine-R-sulfoxide reductase with GAF domain
MAADKRLRVSSDLRKSIETVADEFNKMQVRDKYTNKLRTPNRYLDAENSTIQDLANYVATLVEDLKKIGVIKK